MPAIHVNNCDSDAATTHDDAVITGAPAMGLCMWKLLVLGESFAKPQRCHLADKYHCDGFIDGASACVATRRNATDRPRRVLMKQYFSSNRTFRAIAL